MMTKNRNSRILEYKEQAFQQSIAVHKKILNYKVLFSGYIKQFKENLRGARVLFDAPFVILASIISFVFSFIKSINREKATIVNRLIKLGKLLEEQQQTTKAIQSYREAIAIQNNCTTAYFCLGKLLATQRKFNEAVTHLELAIALEPNLPEAYFALGNILSEEGRREEAIQNYYQAISLKPNWPEAYLDLANKLIQQGRIQDAISNYNKAIVLKQDWAAAYYYRGNALQCQSNYKEAVVDYQKALDLNLNWLELYINLGNALVCLQNMRWAQKKLKVIITKIQEIITLDENQAVNYYNLGLMYESLGQLSEALENYQRAVIINPNQAEVHFAIGNLFLQQGQYERALKSHRLALGLRANWSAQEYFSLGAKPLYFQNHIKGMLMIYKQALTYKPDWVEGYYEAGNWLMHSGHLKQAMQFWQKCTETQEKLAQVNCIDTEGLRIFASDFTRNIGHIGLLDFHIKMDMLGWRPLNDKAIIWNPLNAPVANQCLLNYWNQYIPVVAAATEKSDIPKLLEYAEERIATVTLTDGKTMYYYEAWAAVQQQWEAENRPPLLQLSDLDYERGWNNLKQLGIPDGAWFVSLHVRESGIPKGSVNYPSRDADINTYTLAMQSIVERGGWVIRMGSPKMKPLPKMPQVIDYAHSEIRSDWMDVFLWSQCRFFIGTNSGPFFIPSLFGVPCVLTNWIPLATPPLFGNSLFIPKLLWSEREERYLTFEEMLSLPFGIQEHHFCFAPKQIKVLNNLPQEIQCLVEEVINKDDFEKELYLTKQFQDRLKDKTGYCCNSKIGRNFIKEHSNLI
jgi:putative glycosyltransferase (TIGR04372 family)